MKNIQNTSKINNSNANKTWINNRVKAEEFINKTIQIVEVTKHT